MAAVEIHTAVGAALSTWEGVESQLGWAFALLLDAPGDGAARVYGHVTSFTARHELLHAAFKSYPKRGRDEVAGFPKFLDLVKNFSPRRNEIAHGLVVFEQQPRRGCFLCPAFYNARKRWSVAERVGRAQERGFNAMLAYLEPEEKYAYTAAQVMALSHEFGKLAVQAGRFHEALYDLRKEPPASQQPKPLLTGLLQIDPQES